MICTTIHNMSIGEAIEAAGRSEMIELRLDLLDLSPREISVLSSFGIPVIATCRQSSAGRYETYRRLYRAMASGAMYIDIETDMSPDLAGCLYDLAKENGCRVIRSYHNFVGTEPSDVLEGIASDLSGGDRPADIVKIAVLSKSEEDSSVVMSLYSSPALKHIRGRLVAFAMGEHGASTRIDSLSEGAPFGYASASSVPAAPGQLTLEAFSMKVYGTPRPPVVIDGSVRVPVSKSIAQRVAVASALAGVKTEINNEDICRDTEAALRVAGCILERSSLEKQKRNEG